MADSKNHEFRKTKFGRKDSDEDFLQNRNLRTYAVQATFAKNQCFSRLENFLRLKMKT